MEPIRDEVLSLQPALPQKAYEPPSDPGPAEPQK